MSKEAEQSAELFRYHQGSIARLEVSIDIAVEILSTLKGELINFQKDLGISSLSQRSNPTKAGAARCEEIRKNMEAVQTRYDSKLRFIDDLEKLIPDVLAFELMKAHDQR